jgi:hypothetical protein
MIEIILSICLALGFIGLLVYLYFHTNAEREYVKKIQTDLTNLPIELQKFYATIAEKDQARTQKVLGDTFTKYLKHIERLEKQVLPKPVTTKDVQSVINRMGPLADESQEIAWDNEIEKAEKGVEMPNDEWTGYISGSTKVAFEDDPEPTVVE